MEPARRGGQEVALDALRRLLDVVATLRGPEGCPWDRAQTPATMRPHLLEEAHEVVAALDEGDPEQVAGELGDLLFLVALIARMFEEDGRFDLGAVAGRAADKMVRRHPHVFGALDTQDVGRIRQAWEAAKAEERGPGASALDGLPPHLPAALRAHRVGDKASSVGFDWPDLAGVRAKVTEELGELDEAVQAGEPDAIAEEYGDLLFATAQLGRFLGVGAEDALRQATAKFERRFRAVEAACLADGTDVLTCSPDELERYWQRVKESA